MKTMFPFFDFHAKYLLAVALLSRVSFAALAVIISLKTENGFLVSPFVEIPFGDYNFYLKHASGHFVALKAIRRRSFVTSTFTSSSAGSVKDSISESK